jgi:hypothetical protein
MKNEASSLATPLLRRVAGQPSWRLESSEVEAFVTEMGGQLGPVGFKVGGRTVWPYAVAPWAEEDIDDSVPPMLKALRGDFFCLPFGGNEGAFEGEQHPAHGETANEMWRFEALEEADGNARLHLSLATRIRAGRVDKTIELKNGQSVIYCRHVISGMSGPMNLGHHAMLKFPDVAGSGLLSTSKFSFGQVYPGVFERPENGGYSMLKAGAVFEDLERVPTITGETADLSGYPARRGFEDLVMLQSEQTGDFGWTAVAFPAEGYVWFALKDPRVLRGTVFWLSSGGRHYAPWNGRHVNVMGLEEVTSYFHSGLRESASPNALTERGCVTALELSLDKPTRVNLIMGVAEIPVGFDHVAEIFRRDGGIGLRSRSGEVVWVGMDLRFLEL